MEKNKKPFSLKDNMRWIVILVAVVCVTLIAIELITRFAPQRDFALQQETPENAITVSSMENSAAPTGDGTEDSQTSGSDGFVVTAEAVTEALNQAIRDAGWQSEFTAEQDGNRFILSEPYGTRIFLHSGDLSGGQSGILAPVQVELMSPAAKGEYYAEQTVKKQDTLSDKQKQAERNDAKELAVAQTGGLFEAVPRALLEALDTPTQTLKDMDYHRLTAVLQQSVSSKKEQSALLGRFLIQSIYSTRDGYLIVYIEITPVD